MKVSKIVVLSALLFMSFGQVAMARALPNKVKSLQTEMKSCESKAKKFSNLGYPAKAEKQLVQCQKIKGSIAKIKAGQQKVDRKIASLDKKSPKAKSKAKHKRVAKKHKEDE